MIWFFAASAVALASPSRQIAHSVLVRCARPGNSGGDGAFADRALHSALTKSEHLSASDRAQATEIVYGVMRSMSLLDYRLQQLASSPAFAKKTPIQTLCALRVGAFELLYMKTPDHAAVDEAVSLVGGKAPRAQKSFVNGVLRNLARRRDANSLAPPSDDEKLSRLEAISIETSTPEWLLRELHERSGLLGSTDELAEWAEASSKRPPLALRVNRRKSTGALVLSKLLAAGLTVESVEGLEDALLLDTAKGKVSDLPGFAEGEFSVQDVGAQLVALLAAPIDTPDALVLDCCAAPGGKSCHLAELIDETSRVVSVEVHARKARLIEQSAARLGLEESVQVRVADATSAQALLQALRESRTSSGGGSEGSEGGGEGSGGGSEGSEGGEGGTEEGAAERLADAVILDAPCSGLGTLRRNPEHRYRSADPSGYTELCKLQATLLDATAGCVRVGGTLTYSVCSPLLEETDAAVAAFLERQAGSFEVVRPTLAALETFVADSAALGPGTCVRSWTHRHPADGHFACKLVRCS